MGPPHPRPDSGVLLHAGQWRLAGRDCAEVLEDGGAKRSSAIFAMAWCSKALQEWRTERIGST
jgi:hypothetical protein